ncbi:universal stress protein [Amnibacterium soli]|uniref:Universal stress protein n=1 Tax=Amnibacterium soli TaxID=1282736 RepID=A0ABP8YZ31_9MICO
MTDRLVVGWDGTAAARSALEWAVRHEPACAELELVVADARGNRPSAAPSAEVAAERLRAARPHLRVSVAVERGSAATVLSARSGDGVLVVLGGADPGRGRHRSSVAYRVAATASGPVAMVPEGFDHGRDVVLGVGDDPCAPSVALAAAGQAAQRGQRLVAVHAWREFLDLDVLVDLDPHHDGRVARERDAVLAHALTPVAERFPAVPLVRRVVHGRPVDAVLGAASTASLLVLGRDEQGVARRGRPVAHVAMLASRVPVLVVPRRAVA